MKISVKYMPCLFDESTWISFESTNQTILAVFVSLFQKFPEVREDSPMITVRVNGKILHPSLWNKPLADGDEVLIIQEIGMVIDWILAAIGVSSAIWGTTCGTIATAVFAVASIAYTIYSYCTAPKPPREGPGLNSSPTYGWDGLQMQCRQGVPVPIVYGEHTIPGNITGGKL